MAEFSDMLSKCSSNFKLIGLKLKILEIWPMLTFWSMLTFLPMVSTKKQVVEFGDLFGKSCSNFKSIGWKLMILDICPMLTFWSLLTFWFVLTSKIIGCCIQWPYMEMLFKFQVKWIKIEDFRNLAYVDLLVDVDLFTYGDHKNNRWLNLVT